MVKTDILVIGSGLAGMRAAMAARETDPEADITLLTPSSEPCGSSFANIHNQLGMQVCLNENEKRTFIEEAIAIAPPGVIDTELVRILVEESLGAFKYLQSLGASVMMDSTGHPVRVKGCFSPVQPRAYILTDMHRFYYRLLRVLEHREIRLMVGYEVIDLLTQEKAEGKKVVGADAKRVGDPSYKIKIGAGATILAIGGQASQFKRTIAGTGRSSMDLHEWCRSQQIRYTNESFTQYVWCRATDFGNWSIMNLADKKALFRGSDGKERRVPDHLRPLFQPRSTHAPVSYGLEDRALDELLMDNLNKEDCIDVFHPDRGWEKVVIAAQVSNGGIRIDQDGWAGMDGLYACGECAGGMHGANRIGGGMVLSTQVFGDRAGKAAVRSIR